MLRGSYRTLLVIVLLALAAGSIFVGFRHGMQLFDFHWESAALFLRGENPYQYYFDGRCFQGVFVDATQAPSTIAFILPYGLFSHYVGNLLWAVSNVCFLFILFFFVWKTFFSGLDSASRGGRDGTVFLALFALFAMGTPYRVCLGNGQHAMISMACFVLAYWAMEREKSFWLVGFLMAASLFKYTFAVPLAFVFLFRRQWKAMMVCAGIHVAATAILGWWTQTNPVELVLQSMKVGVAIASAGGDADWAGLAHWFGVTDIWAIAISGYVFFGFLLFLVTFTGRRDTLLKVAIFALIANVMFYHRVYDFVTLLFPLLYVLTHRDDQGAVDRLIRWSTFVTVAFVFYGVKLLDILHLGFYIPLCSALSHMTLILFLVKLLKDESGMKYGR